MILNADCSGFCYPQVVFAMLNLTLDLVTLYTPLKTPQNTLFRQS